MKYSIVDTWLPVFSGFYGTIWETDSGEEMELDNINEQRRAKGLPEVTWDAVEWDYKGYTDTVSKMVTSYVTGDLKKLGVIRSGTFQELRSPREYNFANDSVNVQFTLTPANIKRIAAYLKEHEEAFSKYLEDKYTSRDGFMSFHSPDLYAWIGDNLGPVMGDGHKAGSVLNFILLNEEGQDYEMTIYEHVSENGGYITAANYDALTSAGVK